MFDILLQVDSTGAATAVESIAEGPCAIAGVATRNRIQENSDMAIFLIREVWLRNWCNAF